MSRVLKKELECFNIMEEKNLNTQEKLSYEQLENICHQLSQQSRELYTKLQQAEMSNMWTRLNFLFEVLKNSIHFSEEFVEKATNEIEQLMAFEDSESENIGAKE